MAVGVVGFEASTVAALSDGCSSCVGDAAGKDAKCSTLSFGEGGESMSDGSGDMGGLESASPDGCTSAVVEAFGSSDEGKEVFDGEGTNVPCIRADWELDVSGFDLKPLFAEVGGLEIDLPPSSG